MNGSSNPSDLSILREIYESYLDQFVARVSADDEADSQDKVYLPIDVQFLASKLGMNKHILWGRLYYHLDAKHRYKDGDEEVHLFAMQVGKERHCINFPLLSAIVAEREREVRRYLIPLVMSGIALGVAIVSLVIKSH